MLCARAADDTCLDFCRIDGNGRAPIVGFLPWKTPFRLALSLGLIPRDFLACYEMPPGIVSSEPEVGVTACVRLVEDAMAVMMRGHVRPARASIIGLSIGNAPATYLANQLGAQLISIASADRGDLLLWQSPGAAEVKQRAMEKGYTLADFTAAMESYHPMDNLSGIAAGSTFVIGSRDELIPKARRDGLLTAVRRNARAPRVTVIDASHAGTLVYGVAGLVLERTAARAV